MSEKSERGKKERNSNEEKNNNKSIAVSRVLQCLKKPKKKPNQTTFIHIHTIYLYSYIFIYAYKTPKIKRGREGGRRGVSGCVGLRLRSPTQDSEPVGLQDVGRRIIEEPAAAADSGPDAMVTAVTTATKPPPLAQCT